MQEVNSWQDVRPGDFIKPIDEDIYYPEGHGCIFNLKWEDVQLVWRKDRKVYEKSNPDEKLEINSWADVKVGDLITPIVESKYNIFEVREIRNLASIELDILYVTSGNFCTITAPDWEEILMVVRNKVIAYNKNISAGFDPVSKPKHYTDKPIETIDVLKNELSAEEFKGFLRGNVLKYVSRYQKKAGVQDLEKAQWYLTKLIEEEKQ